MRPITAAVELAGPIVQTILVFLLSEGILITGEH
jgi:hypothetical protein